MTFNVKSHRSINAADLLFLWLCWVRFMNQSIKHQELWKQILILQHVCLRPLLENLHHCRFHIAPGCNFRIISCIHTLQTLINWNQKWHFNQPSLISWTLKFVGRVHLHPASLVSSTLSECRLLFQIRGCVSLWCSPGVINAGIFPV